MTDIAVYLVPLLLFIAIVVVVKVRPRRPRAPLTPDRLGRIEGRLSAGGLREVERALRSGHTIQAIAVVRGRTDASLAEAKSLVDAIEKQIG